MIVRLPLCVYADPTSTQEQNVFRRPAQETYLNTDHIAHFTPEDGGIRLSNGMFICAPKKSAEILAKILEKSITA